MIRPIRAPRRRMAGFAVTFALLAGACGAAEDADVLEGATDQAASEASTSDSGGDSSAGGPDTIEGYLGTAARFLTQGRGQGGAGAIDADQLAEEERLIELEVQKCMLANGFEYTPEEAGDQRFFGRVDGDVTDPSEFAATMGFGISTRIDALFEGDVDFTESVDANDEHVATLTEAEADAWQLALRGQQPERNDQGQLIDPETGEVIQGRGRIVGGCRGEAQTAVRGDLSELAELGDAYTELQERIDSDPRLTEIRREWSGCMAEAGFDYQTLAEARDDIRDQFRPLMFSFFGRGEGQGGGDRGAALEALVAVGLTDEQEADLQQLQDLEVATAVAAHGCDGDTADEVADIEARYEAEFVEANRAVLEAFGS